MVVDDARRDLLAALRDSYVVSSKGSEMHTRFRSGPLNIDMQATLTRLSPTHVRCEDVQIRERKSRQRGAYARRQRGRLRGSRGPTIAEDRVFFAMCIRAA